MHENYDLEQLLELVQTRQFRRLRELLVNMNEVDIAEFLDELGPGGDRPGVPSAAQGGGGGGVY